MDGHREPEPHVHARRVVPDRLVDEAVQFGEAHDVVEASADVTRGEAQDGAVQVDVLATGQFRVEAGTQLEERREATVDFRCALVGSEDSGQHLQQGALARAVAADDPERGAVRDLQVQAPECPEFLVADPVPGQDGGLQRPVPVVRETELLSQPVQGDGVGRCRSHAQTSSAMRGSSRLNTRKPMASTMPVAATMASQRSSDGNRRS